MVSEIATGNSQSFDQKITSSSCAKSLFNVMATPTDPANAPVNILSAKEEFLRRFPLEETSRLPTYL